MRSPHRGKRYYPSGFPIGWDEEWNKGEKALKKQNRQSVLEGALILMAATVVVKVIGALFKIPWPIFLGGGGMGTL